ncbi:MAG: hypothetical protein IJO32_00640 [Bacilli bacterium]|nr:hypothetical protein [Bacilli bacterium]
MQAMGSTLTKIKSGSELEDTKIANLTKIGEVGVEREERDITDLDSPDEYKEFEPGLKDAGECEIEGYVKTEENVNKLLSLAESGSVENWKITLKSGSTWEFKAWLKKFKTGELTTDGNVTFSGTLRITGKPTFTKVTS